MIRQRLRGRVLPSHGWGHRFNPCRAHHFLSRRPQNRPENGASRIAAWFPALLVAILLWPSEAAARPPAEIPDPARTPGVVATTDDAEVCGIIGGLTYARRHRATSAGLKARVMREYGHRPGRAGDGEVDQSLPLSLGGADVAANLWWQPGRGHGVAFTYREKDDLEDWARRRVCKRHALRLGEAQAIFLAPDWRIEFCRRIGGSPCPRP